MPVSSRPDGPSVRTRACIVLFVLCCLLSTIRVARDAPYPRHTSVDVSIRSDQRFSALKARLPAHGVIGYIGEMGASATPDYYLTQYALAPLVVDASPHHAIVIGNFPSSQPSHIPQDLQVVADFGNGVMLFANKDAD
jgi:hypothetical protein